MDNNIIYDYGTMNKCGNKLNDLKQASDKNKEKMDAAFEMLATGAQAETGKAFIAAYSEHVTSIKMFADILQSEADLLRDNVKLMQSNDDEIAAEIRRRFSL